VKAKYLHKVRQGLTYKVVQTAKKHACRGLAGKLQNSSSIKTFTKQAEPPC